MKYLRKFNENSSDDFSGFIKKISPDLDFNYSSVSISDIKDKIISDIFITEDKSEVYFLIEGEGIYEFYKMYHEQDCCESVSLYDVNGDLNDIIGHLILKADEATKKATNDEANDDSGTWTFYKLATIKGYVTLRWLGESNGYYSESVDFVKANNIAYSYDEAIQLIYGGANYR